MGLLQKITKSKDAKYYFKGGNEYGDDKNRQAGNKKFYN
jgi:hypothetical protein